MRSRSCVGSTRPIIRCSVPRAEDATTVGAVSLDELSGAPHVLPPLDPVDNVGSPYGIAWLADRLRQPDGCPWDREQDHVSLRPFLLEETYEVYDALDGGSTPKLAEELGDLLLQVVLHAQYAAEDGVFDLADVQRSIMTKIVRRHPHVFGDVEAATATDVMRNWEQLKAAERAADGTADGADDGAARDPGMPDAFSGLSTSLPALAYADEMQGRAAALGYDWPDLEGVIDKVAEEASELLAADGHAERVEEYGDLLFVIVNLGRKLGIDPEASLRAASRKFASRFARVERHRRPAWRRAAGPGPRRARRAVAGGEGRREGDPMSIGGGMRFRADGRTPGQLRPVSIELDVQKWTAASLVYRQGDTHVLCSATLEDRIPPHLRGKGTGWVTAEYAMLPGATSERMQRESVRGKLGGRTYEIQRLVGRSLRGVVNTAALGERTVTIDCDVLQADGGTRCASITGGFIALALASAPQWAGARDREQDRGHQRRHRGGQCPARPRVHRGLARGGRLQRGRHRCRDVCRGPGHGRGQALRPRAHGAAPVPRRRRDRATLRSPERSHRARHRAPLMGPGGSWRPGVRADPA